jgi:serine/threonine-protein kinase
MGEPALQIAPLPPVPRGLGIATMELESFVVGDVVDGRYELLEHLAAGSFGVVFRAQHRVTRRVVALKLLHPWLGDDASLVERTAREAQFAAALRHPNIVELVDAGRTAEGHPFLAMEHLRGQTLRERIGAGPLALAEVARVMAPIASAVATAHAAGIVHRDLKPENVMLVAGEHGPMPKVLDFGLAAALEYSRARQRLTAIGTVLGTLTYMAPEQAIGGPSATGFDVYALGIVLYELLTGELPFAGEGYAELVHAKVIGAVQERPLARAAVPRAWRALVHRCLAIEPSDRPDAKGLHSELLRLGADSSRPCRDRPTARGLWLAVTGMLVTAAAAIAACR